MKRSCNRTKYRISKEAGFALVLFMLTLPVLLGLTLLAIDIANLLLARQIVNKVARVSAASAINLRALRGWASFVTDIADEKGRQTGGKDPNAKAALETKARELAATTMTQAAVQQLKSYFPADGALVGTYFDVWNGTTWKNLTGAPNDFQTVLKKSLWLGDKDPSDPTKELTTEQIRFRYRYKVNTIFLSSVGRLLGMTLPATQCDDYQSRCYVQSDDVASGKVVPAKIYLLLDTSWSMAKVVSGGKSKKNYLDAAVAQFIDYFNPYRDKISLIPFGNGVKSTRTTLSNFSASTNKIHLDVKEAVVKLRPQGMTNHCDALIEAIRQIPTGPDPSFVVLFTDGAPNTYRLTFCNDNACTQEATRLSTLKGAPTGYVYVAGPSEGWYGWTVPWGKRKVYKPDSIAARDRDPVFGLPLFYDCVGSTCPAAPKTLDASTVDQDGTFRVGSTGIGAPTNQSSWYMQYESLDPKYGSEGEEGNYQWYGPSYLVYADWTNFGDQGGLGDRIPSSMLSSSIKTCGSPGRTGTNGTGTTYNINEQYNHPRYFASRVVDSSWSLTRQRSLVGLDKVFGSAGIPFISFLKSSLKRDSAGNLIADRSSYPLSSTAPGCLTTLNAVIPFTAGTAQIYVGPSFLSNLNPAATVQQVGEIVKTAELPYYCAIRAADYLRQNRNTTIFIVGLGAAAENVYGSSCNDPMQNALDLSSRKDYFLRRLAFAPESLAAPETFISTGASAWASSSDFTYRSIRPIQCTNHPLNQIAVNIGYSNVTVGDVSDKGQGVQPGAPNSGLTPSQLGAYYGSNDPSQLNALFAKIAKQILARLSN